MYETQNNKILTRMAKADLKSGKTGNLIIMMTIILAAGLLMVMGLFPGSVKLEAQRLLKGAQDVIYHGTSAKQIKKLEQDGRFSCMTLRKTGEQMEAEDYIIWQVYYDITFRGIKTLKLTEGSVPKTENQVAVSKAYIRKLGMKPRLGMTISVPFLSGKKETCVVSGFTKELKSSVYPILRSKVYAEKGQGMKDVPYDVLAKVKGSKDMTRQEFLSAIRDAAGQAGIPRSSVNENDSYLGILSGGLSMQESITFAVVGLIILTAGVMVIYSVFYISVTGKTREYGQLRTLGMTKKQTGKLVRKEGLILALRAAPAGLLPGSLISWGIKPKGFSPANTLLMALVVLGIILVTVFISVMKPARLAASVSPIEAARYSAYTGEHGRKSTKKLRRRITPLTLAAMNSSRNRKKTFVTALSLGLGGILFIGAVTFANSFDKEKFARQGEFSMGEFVIRCSGNAEKTAKGGEWPDFSFITL